MLRAQPMRGESSPLHKAMRMRQEAPTDAWRWIMTSTVRRIGKHPQKDAGVRVAHDEGGTVSTELRVGLVPFCDRLTTHPARRDYRVAAA